MKNFFLKYLIAAFFFNVTILFSQVTNEIDSLFEVIDKKINNEEFVPAEVLILDFKKTSSYKSDSVKLSTDLLLAQLYLTQNKDTLAIEILLNGLSKIKEGKLSKYTSDYAFEVAKNFTKIKNYPKAFEYYRIVLENSKNMEDSLRISKGLWGIGSVHFNLYKDGLFGGNYVEGDSTLHYHQEAIKYFPKNVNDKKVLAGIYSNLVGFYYYQEEYDVADDYGRKSLNIYEELNDSLQMESVIYNLAAVSTIKGDFEKAKSYYVKGLNLVNNRKSYDSKEMKRNFLRNLANLNYRQKNYKIAYEYRTNYDRLKDSLREVSANEKYAEIEAKFNVAEEEKLTEIEKNKRQRAEYWLYGFGIALVLLLVSLGLVFRAQKLKRENLALELKQEKLLQDRKIELVQNEAQIKILNATIDGKETERHHIAEILHNSVSALLSSANLHLHAAKIELAKPIPEEINKTQSIITEAADKIRDLSHILVSPILLKFGLSHAIEDLCEKYTNSQLTFDCQSDNVQRYNQEFEVKLNNIIEELANNIIKHSNATQATIILEQKDSTLQVRIFDNGHGFNVNEIKTSTVSGLGLPQIEARIKMMKGIFEIKSSKEKGTHIYINVPIPN